MSQGLLFVALSQVGNVKYFKMEINVTLISCFVIIVKELHFVTRVLDSSCVCKDFIGKYGYGNCNKKSKHKEHEDQAICYVIQPSGCQDLVDSDTDLGEKLSAQACSLKGSC